MGFDRSGPLFHQWNVGGEIEPDDGSNLVLHLEVADGLTDALLNRLFLRALLLLGLAFVGALIVVWAAKRWPVAR